VENSTLRGVSNFRLNLNCPRIAVRQDRYGVAGCVKIARRPDSLGEMAHGIARAAIRRPLRSSGSEMAAGLWTASKAGRSQAFPAFSNTSLFKHFPNSALRAVRVI
jgi:hypothetical protein